MYIEDADFKEGYEACKNPLLGERSLWTKFLIQDGLLVTVNMPIFNVADLYPYRRDEARESYDKREFKWEEQLPTVEKLLGMCYILCMCVCVGASDTTTASDDPFT
jgi:hypothetical protein